MQNETQRFLDALERCHGTHSSVRHKVAPVVRRIFETDNPARRELLDAVTVVYGYHVKAQLLIDELAPDVENRFAA